MSDSQLLSGGNDHQEAQPHEHTDNSTALDNSEAKPVLGQGQYTPVISMES